MTKSANSPDIVQRPGVVQEKLTKQSGFHTKELFKSDFENYDGVPRINIYLLRVLFTLMFVFLTFDSWSHIINHKGSWDVADAAAWCMWGSYSVISFIGILRPLKMLPIILLDYLRLYTKPPCLLLYPILCM